MRRIALIIGFLLSLQLAAAQRSVYFTSSDRLFYEAKAMYEDNNFAGCIDKLNQYKQGVVNPERKEEADYYLVASDFYQGEKDMALILKDFLDTYPGSAHRNEIYFMIGSEHFSKGEYRYAIHWLNETQEDFLPEAQKDDRNYRLAIAYLKIDKLEEANALLQRLKDSRHRNAANYYLGYIAYLKNDYKTASSLFSPLKNNPDFQPEVLYYLNQINFAEARYTQTINEGKALISTYPTNPLNAEMERVIGISYYYEEDYNRTVLYLKSYLDKAETPASKDFYVIGSAYYFLADYPNAIAYLNRSNHTDDELGQYTYLYLGQSYLKTGDKEKALRAFESASRMDYNPGIKESAMYNYAMLLHQTSVSVFGESVTVLENFLNTYPNSSYADQVNDALVEVYLTTKNYETALASINKIKNPGSKILAAKQKIYYYLGTVDFTNNHFDAAIDRFDSAIRMGNYAEAEKNKSYYWRGESYYKEERYSEAIQDFRTYLQSGDRTDNLRELSHYNIGYSYFKMERFNDAQAAFQSYINSNKDGANTLADAYARLGDCYFYKRSFDEARKAYAQSVAQMPSRADYALFQEGYVLGLQKDYQGKINKIEKLEKDFPNSSYIPDAIYEKGRSYVLLNKNHQAIESYKNLIARFPNNNLARKAALQIGLLYYNDDNSQEAIKAYKDLIARYPGSEETQVALQDLRSIYMELNQVDDYVRYANSLGNHVRVDATEQDSLTYMAAERIFMSGDYKKAQEGMQKYLQSYPEGAFSTNAYYYLGNAYYQNKNYASAKEELAKVLDKGDNLFTEQALDHLADIAYTEKNYQAALGYYERMEKIASSKANRDKAGLGIIRSAAHLNQHNSVVAAANKLSESELNPDINAEILLHRGKSLLALKEHAQAVKDLETLGKDTRTVFGAEGKYLLAAHYYLAGQNAKAKAVINEYFKMGTPHPYWLAKSYILMSDILASEGDILQARQYLTSLKSNYPQSDDDIHYIIQDRLTILDKK